MLPWETVHSDLPSYLITLFVTSFKALPLFLSCLSLHIIKKLLVWL